ncbi:exosome component 10-like, partial [Centruroides sculpturatus]|uniref:exosome component 10-like n=1 Tax=Centruroides sculpturatus TaxID=218467 RepID=UPI000C6E0C91
MDVQWLQRDFGVYVVNLFDSHQASRLLNFPHNSLAYLLKHYCGIEAKKEYQLADWRIRPLPEELIRYAREDTHYLLYIYDMERNELIGKGNEQQNLLLSVYQRSKLVCLKKYEKPHFDENSYLLLYKKGKKTFNIQQLNAFKNLFAWRDKVARQEDESWGYVLPNHMLFQIAEVLPREQQGLMACCHPVPPLLRQYLNEVHKIILEARELSLTQ